ncbi:MAG: hypothetical protein KGM47_14835 [Acidobacteriota bacterium]|nr:hypothetical protein [Acidobacteriota bacterium]
MHSAKFCIVAFVFAASPLALFGAGGACPSGANYLSLINPTGAKVALSAFGITSCYYVAANGSDSNSGTSESSPWLHAPGMPACAATCASVTPAAGEGFIFRGGDIWHFGNTSGSPYTGGSWVWNGWSGTSSSYIYIGVDPAWYSGSSWSRPILNTDNPTSTSPVSSCPYQIAANASVSFSANREVYLSGDYTIFDNFEMTGLCWNSNYQAGGTGGIYFEYVGTSAGNGNVAYIENNYLHGWTHTSAGAQAGGMGFFDYNQNFGEIFRFNVVDGADSDVLSLAPWGENSSGYDIEYNVTNDIGGGGDVFQACHIMHDNLFENIYQNTDGSTHSDIAFCYGEYGGGSSDPNLFYNNIFRNVAPSGTPFGGYVFTPDTPSGQTDYIFNNVFHDVNTGGSGNNNAMCDQGNCGPSIMWNNTAEGGLSGSVPSGIVWGNGRATVALTSVNNYWVSTGTGTSAVFTGPSYVTESNAIYQTLSTANSQGYTSANDFSPTSSSAATVTAVGANQTNGYCADSVLHNAAAEAACKQGITGVSYNQTNHTVVYPAFPAVLRPATGAWQVGASEKGPSTQVDPPSNLTAITH